MVLMGMVWYALVALVVLGCGDNSGPGQDVSGAYRATQVRLTRGDRTVDLFTEGASVLITLQATGSGRGTTNGSLFLPAGYTESGGGQTESLLGTYTYDPSTGTVAFDHDSDSFFPYMEWHVRGTMMSASFTAGTQKLEVTLERED